MSVTIGVILGSNRPNRAGIAVANWFMKQTKKHTNATFKFIDLEKVNLPFLDEPIPPSSQQYQHQHTKKWSKTIDKLDGYIVITPEYNRGYPAVLKNALDFVYHEWNKKPIGFVGYGGMSGGLRAVEQLRLVAVELQMVPVREAVAIPVIWEQVVDGKLNEASVHGNYDKLIEDVIWWAELIKPAREQQK
jgi:NAD(P)H-dependent FMN reductase